MIRKSFPSPKKGHTLLHSNFLNKIWRQRVLLLMLIPGLAYYLIYKYGPMFGLVIAFKDYSPFLGVLDSPWAGFKHFLRLFSNNDFWLLFRNTLAIGVFSLIFAFPAAILFALLLNEVHADRAKKFYQTVSYLPNFLSIVIVCSIFTGLFSNSGVINQIIGLFGGEAISFMYKSNWYYVIYIVSEIWAGMGAGAIVYIAALAGVDQTLYEAAEIDGCSRWKKIWKITLPAILPTIITMLLLRIGNIIRVAPDKTLLLYTPMTMNVADVFGSFVHRVGIEQRSYSFASAVGLFESVLASIILYIANRTSKRATGESLW